MELQPTDSRDYDPQAGVILTGEGEVRVRPRDLSAPHPVEFDGFARPETAQLAANIAVRAQMGFTQQ